MPYPTPLRYPPILIPILSTAYPHYLSYPLTHPPSSTGQLRYDTTRPSGHLLHTLARSTIISRSCSSALGSRSARVDTCESVEIWESTFPVAPQPLFRGGRSYWYLYLFFSSLFSCHVLYTDSFSLCLLSFFSRIRLPLLFCALCSMLVKIIVFLVHL